MLVFIDVLGMIKVLLVTCEGQSHVPGYASGFQVAGRISPPFPHGRVGLASVPLSGTLPAALSIPLSGTAAPPLLSDSATRTII